MKRLFLFSAILIICFGACSVATASPTLTLTGTSESDSTGTNIVKDNSNDSGFFLKDWLYWLLDNVFGWDQNSGKKSYYSSTSVQPDTGGSSGDSNFDNSNGSDDWYWDSDSGNWDSGSGNSGSGGNPDDSSGYNPNDNDWGFNTDGNVDYNNGSGGDGWNGDPSAGWDRNDSGTSPPQTIPAPGAIVLCGIGSGLVSWLRRRKAI